MIPMARTKPWDALLSAEDAEAGDRVMRQPTITHRLKTEEDLLMIYPCECGSGSRLLLDAHEAMAAMVAI